MTIYEICQLITALTAVGTLGVSIWNSQKIKEVHNLTNSKMTELVAEVREGSLAKGNLEGRAAVRTEEDAKRPG